MSVWSFRQPKSRYLNKGIFISLLGLALLLISPRHLAAVEPSSSVMGHDGTADKNKDSNGEQNALPQVTVEARRKAIEKQAYDFVRKATQNPRFRDESLPRWNVPLCFAVGGLPSNEGLYAIGRLRDIARGAGARVAQGRCKYNFIVVFAAEPDQLLKKAFRRQPRALDRCQGMQEIENFVSPSKPQPIRVWHNTRLFSHDGTPIGSNLDCGSIGVDKGDFPISPQYSPSRLERYDVFAFSLAVVIVDTAYRNPLKLGQLVDYAAMVGLADIAPESDLGETPSILRIFGQPADQQASGLTRWDEAFLSALYHSDQANVTQRSQIADKMSHDILP